MFISKAKTLKNLKKYMGLCEILNFKVIWEVGICRINLRLIRLLSTSPFKNWSFKFGIEGIFDKLLTSTEESLPVFRRDFTKWLLSLADFISLQLSVVYWQVEDFRSFPNNLPALSFVLLVFVILTIELVFISFSWSLSLTKYSKYEKKLVKSINNLI